MIPRINIRYHSKIITLVIKVILILLLGTNSSLKSYRSDSLFCVATLDKFYLYLVFLECMAKQPRVEGKYINP